LNLARKCPYADGKAAIVRIFGELGELVDRKLEMAVFDELARTNIGPVTFCSLGFFFSLNPGAQLHKSMSQICSLLLATWFLPIFLSFCTRMHQHLILSLCFSFSLRAHSLPRSLSENKVGMKYVTTGASPLFVCFSLSFRVCWE